MKAIRVAQFGGPEVLKLVDLPSVPQPTAKQLLIKIEAVGVNPVETYIRSGAYARLPKLPFTPGNDAAGVVTKIGSDITRFHEGDRVFCTRGSVTGTYAEYCVAAESSVWYLPSSLSYAQGAAIGIPYFTAYRALVLKCQVKETDKVLIHGATGGVGIAAVQICKELGVEVYGTGGTEEGLKSVLGSGAVNAYNHRDPEYLKVMEAECGKFDVIVEMLSNVNLQNDLTLLAPNGKVAVVGCRGPIEINPRSLMGQESSIIGVGLGMNSTPEEWVSMGEWISEALKGGTLKPVIGQEYPLANAAQAHIDVIENRGTRGKLVLINNNQ